MIEKYSTAAARGRLGENSVSALIPTFNRRQYVRRAIDSILAQSVPVDEIIVVDDQYSTDNIAEALQCWYGSRVRVILGQGGGLSGARWRGIQEARGEWIAFLDSDDDWPPERNEQFLQAATRIPDDVAWIFGNTKVIRDGGESTTFFEEFGLVVNEWPHVFEDSLSVQFPFQFGVLSSSFIRRRVLSEFDCFKESLQHSEDVLAGFQVASRYRFAAIPSIVGSYFRTSDLIQNSALLKGMWGPDYSRARMLAFATTIKAGKKKPWHLLYASEVRGLCQALLRTDKPVPRRLAIEQFRFGGFSCKGLAFACAVLTGRMGIQIWNRLNQVRKKLWGNREPKSNMKQNGFSAYVQSFEKQ